MGVTVRIPAPLRDHAGGRAEIKIEAATAREALELLALRHPALRRHLFTDEGRLRGYVNVYVNQDDTRGLAGEATAVAAGDVVSIVPSIAGG